MNQEPTDRQNDAAMQNSYPDRMPATTGDGFGIASMVLGIVGLLGVCCCLGVPLGILAVVFAFVSRARRKLFSGMAIAGLVCGAVALVLGVVILVRMITGANQIDFSDPSYQQLLDQWKQIFSQFETNSFLFR